MDKNSYALGMSIAHNMLSSGIKSVEFDDFAAGVKAVLTGAEPAVSFQEAGQLLDKYFAELEAEQKAQVEAMSAAMREEGEAKMITDYVSEDKATPVSNSECPFSMEKIAELSDEAFLRLSQPVQYDIKFETETYRSGRKHIKKTRYKENPYGKIIAACEDGIESVASAEIDMDALEAFRKKFPVLNDSDVL